MTSHDLITSKGSVNVTSTLPSPHFTFGKSFLLIAGQALMMNYGLWFGTLHKATIITLVTKQIEETITINEAIFISQLIWSALLQNWLIMNFQDKRSLREIQDIFPVYFLQFCIEL